MLVGSWLAQRDINDFAAQGRAPMTSAKREMFTDALGSLDYCVYNGIADGSPPFDTNLISVEDVLARLPFDFRNLKPMPTTKSLALALAKAGAKKLQRVSLGKPLPSTGAERTVLWAIRRSNMYDGLDPRVLASLFWKEREERSETFMAA